MREFTVPSNYVGAFHFDEHPTADWRDKTMTLRIRKVQVISGGGYRIEVWANFEDVKRRELVEAYETSMRVRVHHFVKEYANEMMDAIEKGHEEL